MKIDKKKMDKWRTMNRVDNFGRLLKEVKVDLKKKQQEDQQKYKARCTFFQEGNSVLYICIYIPLIIWQMHHVYVAYHYYKISKYR